MGDNGIRVLLVEDNPRDARLIREMLAEAKGTPFDLECADRLTTGLERLAKGGIDLVLLDLGLPDSQGLDTLARLQARAQGVPLVVLTGLADETLGLKAVQEGAQDYLLKGRLNSHMLSRVVRYAIERKRAEEELRSSEERYRDLFENANDLIQSVTPDGHFLYVNNAWRSVLGYSPEEVAHLTLWGIIHPDSRDHCREIFQRVMSGETVNNVEAVFVAKDGRLVLVDGNVNCRFEEGKPVVTRGIFRDVTERKRADELFKTMHDQSPIGIYIVEDGKFQYVNLQFAKLIGYSADELLGTDSLSYVLPEDRKIVRENAIAMLKGRQDYPYEYRVTNKAGDIRHVMETVTSIPYQGRRATLGNFMDVTERKRAEEELKSSEERLKILFEFAPDAYYLSDLKGNFIDGNRAAEELTGYQREELVGKSFLELHLLPPRQIPKAAALLAKNALGQSTGPDEFILSRKDGSHVPVEIRTFTVKIKGQALVLGIARDITERKQAEETLRESEEKYRSLFENMLNGLAYCQILVDENNKPIDFVYLEVNDAFERLTGLRKEDIIGKKVTEAIPGIKESNSDLFDIYGKVALTGEPTDFEVYFEPLAIWLTISVYSPRRGYFVAVFENITERKRAEETLRESEEKYSALVEKSTDGIVIIQDGVMKFVNPISRELVGYTPEELIGIDFLKMVTPQSQETVAKRYADRMAGKEVPSLYEIALIKKDGTTVPVEVNATLINYQGRPADLVLIRDITERKRAEEARKEVGRMKSEFISNISHELRSPLHSIKGFTRLILDDKVPDPETRKEFLAIVDEQSEHLGNLIDNLLDMSRLESGRFSIQKRLTSVKDVIHSAVESFYAVGEEKGIVIAENIPEKLPEIEVDGERLKQVMVNLLSNAIKFSEDGGPITVKVEGGRSELLVQVTDRGSGIPEEAMSHLFERFHQAETASRIGGTGLGLYISKQIIEAHGGLIWVESKEKEGSTFSFTLPLAQAGGDSYE